MADFDPFANQGGPAAWDPEHGDDSKKLTEELLKKLDETDDEPGTGPSAFSGDDADTYGPGAVDTDAFDLESEDADAFETDGD